MIQCVMQYINHCIVLHSKLSASDAEHVMTILPKQNWWFAYDVFGDYGA